MKVKGKKLSVIVLSLFTAISMIFGITMLIPKTDSLAESEAPAQTVNYSVKTFVYNKQNAETDVANLAKALYSFGKATVAYKGSL